MTVTSRLFFALATTTFLTSVNAETLKHIQIQGNQRIESETVISYLPVKVGGQFDQSTVDQSLKDLFATGYFNDVQVSKNGSTLVVKVDENPIINQVAFEGNSKLKDEQIQQEVNLRPREVLSRTKIQSAQQRILEIYRRMGRFGAKVDPKIIKQNDNRVDLVFEINEGDVTYVEKVNFVGNKRFSTSKLEEQILTKRERWYRFFASDDVYDPDRFVADQQNLRKFYYDNGYPDFRIVNAAAELSPDKKDFYLTFTVEEGAEYKLGKVDVTSAIKDVPADALKSSLTVSEGDIYSGKQIEKTVTKITNELGSRGYAFVSVEPQITKNREAKTADVTFEIKEGPRVYIDKIQVIGNDRTRDEVIRREMAIHEGDAYNTSKIKISEQRLKDLGYFKNVSVETEQGDAPDRAKIVIKVEEQSTGELKLSGGFSTLDGPVVSVGVIERNFRGTGQTIHTDLSIAKRRQDFNVGIVEPYFLDRELEASADLYSIRSTRVAAFTQVSTGTGLGLGYKLQEYLTQSINYSAHLDKISHIAQTASVYLQQQKRNTFTSSIGQTLTYDRRDSRRKPTEGYMASFNTTYAGLGGNVFYLSHELSGAYYHPIAEDVIAAIRASVGGVERVGKQLRVTDCVYLGADSFRGFEYAGIGPRDGATGDALGGRRFWKSTVETQFPIGLPNEFGVKGAVFTDFGSLWKSAASGANVRDKNALRASVGVGMLWDSPFGPIRVDYAIAVKKQRYDQTQRLNIGFSTLF